MRYRTEPTKIANLQGAYYAIRISILNSTAILPETSFQLFFARRAQLQDVTDGEGKSIPNSRVSFGSDIAKIALPSGLPKGKNLLVTALSPEMPVQVRCVDKILPAHADRK
jgi:hypothetical protein